MSRAVRVNVVPGLAQGLWGGTGSWLGVLLCLIALIYQTIHLGNLQRELSSLQKSKEQSSMEVRKFWENQLCSRQKRDVTGMKKRRHTGNRSLLHLVPQSIYSNVSQDRTEISWKVSLQQGKSLKVEDKSVQVKHSGIYSIYSQVFYTDPTYTMGHIILRKTEGGLEDSNILLRCVQSMPGEKSLAFNTCFTSGVFQLQKGQTITLVIPRRNASLDIGSQATFLGIVKL
ncbi:tumor necrosis factor ligand superfamily member 13 [Hyla sarda]|uniref:tumor necrosis factor ligand superfamily member 13 n=1 Tax=Hyla sarda TaxID=327740 RepID=UPI0024C2E8AF|nr:tumor necrosis factor ligand superfamily member 13 [Hyla sarda]XP_056426059.1 tumor necrosis factor ligand superfamily member 13 [Hyla sarda]